MNCKLKLVCYNMDYKRLCKDGYRYLRTHNPDLIFLQEAQITVVSCIAQNYKYELIYKKEGATGSKYNCILYKLGKFEQGKEFEDDDRKCMAKLWLKDAAGNLSTKCIIAASCHLNYKIKYEQRLENAEKLFNKLNDLQIKHKCPVLVGGDFNCDIKTLQENYSTNFEIPGYVPTERRKHKIDYFAYNNYDNDVTVKLSAVHANVIEGTESLHDPLRAELTIKFYQPYPFNILSFNMNRCSSEMITKYISEFSPKPSLCFLHEVPQGVDTTLLDTFAVIHSETPTWKFSIERSHCDNKIMIRIRNINAIEVTLWEMSFKDYPNHHPVIIASCHKVNTVTEDCVKCLFKILGYKYSDEYSVLIAGDFNIYKFIKGTETQFTIPTYKPTIHRAAYDGVDDACIDFFAYITNPANSVVFQQFSVNPEMISTCSKGLAIYKHGQWYNGTENSTLTEIHRISPHDPLRGKLFIEIKLSSFDLLCINARDTTEKKLLTYCKSQIYPKPDVWIFQNLSKELAKEIQRYSVVSYFIGTKSDVKFTCGNNSGHLKCKNAVPYRNKHKFVVLKVANFEYTTVKNSPTITIALICNGVIENIENYLTFLYHIQKWSMVVVGTFSINGVDQEDICGFKVLKCYDEENTCIGFFAYKNISSMIIEICDPKCEVVEPQCYALRATMHLRVRPMDSED